MGRRAGWRAELADRVRVHVGPKKGVSNAFLRRMAALARTRHFAGVFAADCIPPRLAGRPRFTFIVNLGRKRLPDRNRPLPVGHFVVVAGYPGRVLYVDSYGLPCAQPDVLAFVNSCRRPVGFNLRQVQDFGSVHCGYYALLYALYLDGDYKFPLRFNRKQLRANDSRCVNHLRKIYSGLAF